MRESEEGTKEAAHYGGGTVVCGECEVPMGHLAEAPVREDKGSPL